MCNVKCGVTSHYKTCCDIHVIVVYKSGGDEI